MFASGMVLHATSISGSVIAETMPHLRARGYGRVRFYRSAARGECRQSESVLAGFLQLGHSADAVHRRRMVAHGSTVRLRSGLAAARRAERPGTRTSVFAADQAELDSPRCKPTGAVWQVPHLPEHGKPGVDRINRQRAVRERDARARKSTRLNSSH